MNKLFFYLFIALAFFSCRNRNPNLSEKQFQSLFTEDKKASEEKTTETLTMPEGYVPQAGVKYRQERDLSAPPVRIDIVKGIDHVRNMSLSQIAKDITYINIGKHRFSVDVQVTPYGILVNNPDGVWLYAPDGQLIKEIYKNLCEYSPFGEDGTMVSSSDKFQGVEQVRYDEKNDRLWVKFREDNIRDHSRGFLGYIDMSQLNVSNSEIKQNLIIPLAEFGKGSMNYTEDFVIHQPYGKRLSHDFTTNTFFGDTLCCFTVGNDSITAKATRGVFIDNGNTYMYGGQFTFRKSFSDTLFRITAANKLKPEYLLDAGTSGRATNHCKITDVQIDRMYIIQSVKEDDRHLYVMFSKDYDCPANRSSQKVRFWWGIYDKTNREFFTLPIVSDSNPDEKGIENDLDGGLPFWPRKIGDRGEKYMNVMGKNMKNRLSEKSKTQHSEQLKQFIQSLEDDDRVIIIVK